MNHGYICKRCHGPAPVGVGYVANGADAALASAGLTRCACGYSIDPSTTTNGDGVREQLQAAGEHTLELIESLRRHIDGGDCSVGQGCDICAQYPSASPADAAAAYLSEWPSEVIEEVGTPLALVLGGGGPTYEIQRDVRGSARSCRRAVRLGAGLLHRGRRPMTGATIHDRTPDGLLEIVDTNPDDGGGVRVTVRETMGGGCIVVGFPMRRARTLALSALPGATSARVLRRFVGGTCEHVTFTVSAPAPHTATATREGVQDWRPGCTCGWAHPWHFPSRAAALVAAQSVAAAHRIESGAES